MASSSKPIKSYQTKQIEYLGKPIRIVMQAQNGVCPLIAICNAFLLKNILSVDKSQVLEDWLLSIVTNRLLECVNNKASEKIVTNIISSLEQLTTGLYVDPIFTGIKDFNFGVAKVSMIFHLLGLSFCHGWIIDPLDPAQAVIGQNSYEELTLKLAGAGADIAEIAQHGERIKEFLKQQLTVTGLRSLQETIKDFEPCVFYFNQHYYTLVKIPGAGLFTLVTDESFCIYPDHVWQKLDNVRGPTDGYFNSYFEETRPIPDDKTDAPEIWISAIWDIENCRAYSRRYDAAKNLKDNVSISFPYKRSITAIGNTKKLRIRERTVCDDSGITLMDSPRKIKNASDTKIFVEMFRFVQDHPPPSFLMLVSGDLDFSTPLDCIGKLGYTTVLVYPENRVAPELIELSDYAFSWESMCEGLGLVDKDGHVFSVVRLKDKPLTHSTHKRKALFWEIDSFPLPQRQNFDMNKVHYIVTSHMTVLSFEHEDNEDGIALYAFGNANSIPRQDIAQATGIQYVTTCQSNKKYAIENQMMVKILSVAVRLKKPGHFLIATRNQEFSDVVNFLEARGHTVTIAIRANLEPKGRLERAATHTVEWPWKAIESGLAVEDTRKKVVVPRSRPKNPTSSISNMEDIPANLEPQLRLGKGPRNVTDSGVTLEDTRRVVLEACQGSRSKRETNNPTSISSSKKKICISANMKPQLRPEKAATVEWPRKATETKVAVEDSRSSVLVGARQGSRSKRETNNPTSNISKLEMDSPPADKVRKPLVLYKPPGKIEAEKRREEQKRRKTENR